ncbi:MAG: hypothetical protein ACI30W_04485 [Muribaculaceae bacterium]
MNTYLAYAAIFAASLLMCACAGKSGGTHPGSNDSVAIGGDGVPVDDAMMESNIGGAAEAPTAGEYYTADITAEGGVVLHPNLAKCRELAASRGATSMIGTTVHLSGIEGNCVQLVDANFGNDVNPYLVIRTDKGTVVLYSIVDAVIEGNTSCGAPLYGISDAQWLQPYADESGQGVMAELGDGSKVDIDASDDVTGYYVIDNFVVYLSRDWRIMINDDVVEYHRNGSFHRVGGAKAGAATQRLVADLVQDTKPLHITLAALDEGGFTATFSGGAGDFPLVKSKAHRVRYLHENPYTSGYFNDLD